jgi:hypothetical protein
VNDGESPGGDVVEPFTETRAQVLRRCASVAPLVDERRYRRGHLLERVPLV